MIPDGSHKHTEDVFNFSLRVMMPHFYSKLQIFNEKAVTGKVTCYSKKKNTFLSLFNFNSGDNEVVHFVFHEYYILL